MSSSQPRDIRGGARASWRYDAATPVASVQVAMAIVFGLVVVLAAMWAVALIEELAAGNAVSGHHDFFAFYSASSLIRDGRPEALYDRDAVLAIQRAFFPFPVGFAGYMAYLNPPFAAVLHLPLALMPEEPARTLWVLVNLPLLAMCAVLLTADVRGGARPLVAATLIGTFPVYQALAQGQWSVLLLLACLGALTLGRRGHPIAAGLCLGVLAIKPPVLLLALAWLLFARHWKTAGAAILAAATAVVVALPFTGIGPYVTYARFLTDVALSHTSGAGAAGPSAWSGSLANMEGLNGLAAAIVGQARPHLANEITLAMAALVLVAVALTRPFSRPTPVEALPVALAAGLLLNPNLFGQDCVLALVFLPILAPLVSTPRLQLGLALAIAVVLDSVALDTNARYGNLLYAPHIPTLVLLGVAGVCSLAPQLLPQLLSGGRPERETA